ncbi:tyrosine-type recombinase/integrase [Sphingomonas sp.]|uniref:tyrosine-type recombinase/integrase n=1 Tax=Sphingomonas sp. TaxID=28214 RepID=UPI003AFF8D43
MFPGATSRTTATDFTTWRLPNGEHVPVLSREQRIADFLPTERTAADEIGLGGFMKALVNGPRNDLERRVLAEGSVSAGGAMVPAALAAQVLDAARIRNVAFQAGAMTMPMPAVQTQMAKIVSDVRFMSHETIAGGRIRLDQSKTNNAVDVPVVEPLSDALAAGPLGASLLLETKDGAAFTPKGFYGMMKKACIAAGIPHCSPHGLRKSAARRCREAGCSDDEGMAITGHKSVREYRRYAGEDARGARADTAMGKVMANRASKLAREAKETIDDAA